MKPDTIETSNATAKAIKIPGRKDGFEPSFGSKHKVDAPEISDLMAQSTPWRVDVITTIELLNAIGSQWQMLEKNAPASATGFQSYNWCRAHLNCSNERFAIITFFRGDKLVLVWPLSIHARFGLSIATWLGDPFTQYGDVLIDRHEPQNEIFNHAWRVLRQIPDLDAVTLRKVRSDAAITTSDELTTLTSSNPEQAAILELCEFSSNDDYLKSLKSKQRGNRKRACRKLSEIGQVDFEIVEGDAYRVEIINQAIEFKTQWLTERGLMSRAAFSDNPFGILQALATMRDRGFQTIVSRLSVDGQSAAIEVGFLWNNRYLSYLGCFEPNFAALSPGTIQMGKTVSWLIDKGVKSYDLFAPLDNYKSQWSNSTVCVNNYQFGLNGRGRFYIDQVEGHLIPGLRHLYDRLPESIRHQIAKLILK